MKRKTIQAAFALLPVVFIYGCASYVAPTSTAQTASEEHTLAAPVEYDFYDSNNVQFATVTLILPSPMQEPYDHGKWYGKLSPSYHRPKSPYMLASDKLYAPTWHNLVCRKDSDQSSNAIVNLNPNTPDDVIELLVPISDEKKTGCWSYVTDAGGVDYGKFVGPYHRESQPTPPVVYIGGEFHNPGAYFWTNGMTAADLVRQAGGFTVFAWGMVWIQHYDGTREKYRLKVARELTNGIAFYIPNIPLKPGDQVLNPRR